MARGSVFSILRISTNFKRLLVSIILLGLLYYGSLVMFSSSPNNSDQIYAISFNRLNSGEVGRKSIPEVVKIKPADLKSPIIVNADNETLLLSDEILKQEQIEENSKLPLCPAVSRNNNLLGHVHQAALLIDDMTEEDVKQAHSWIQPGGHWKPADCVAKKKVALVIPYRDRYSHLVRLLDFLLPIMQRQMLDFRFIVTEQYGNDLFNKGRIMNAAFKLAEKLQVDCVIFHDVDMFPQDDRTPYDCPEQPRHIGAFVSNLGYQLWYNELVGGVLAMTMDNYRSLNGYSNLYWAWGGEDDDMGKRILSQNLTIERPNQEYARFSMLKHGKRKRTAPKLIYKLLESAGTRWETDGVNNTSLWSVVSVDVKPLYYHLMVDVGVPPQEWRSES